MNENEKVVVKEEDPPIIKKKLPKCQYNNGVGCARNDRKCATCGWNPEVAKIRKEKIYAKRGLVYAD